MTDRQQNPEKDPLYRSILMVLVASTMIGALCALAGGLVLANPAVQNFGFIVVVVCGGLYFFFRFLGRRAAKRQDRDPG